MTRSRARILASQVEGEATRKGTQKGYLLHIESIGSEYQFPLDGEGLQMLS